MFRNVHKSHFTRHPSLNFISNIGCNEWVSKGLIIDTVIEKRAVFVYNMKAKNGMLRRVLY